MTVAMWWEGMTEVESEEREEEEVGKSEEAI